MFAGILSFALDHWEWVAALGAAPLAAIPFAGPILVFLKGNWKGALPWILAAAGLGGALWYRGELKDCRASVAIDAVKAQELVRGQKAADAEFRRQLSESLAPIVDDLRKQANDTQVALARVQSDPNCGRTPAARAFDGVVRPVGGGQADPGRSRPARP